MIVSKLECPEHGDAGIITIWLPIPGIHPGGFRVVFNDGSQAERRGLPGEPDDVVCYCTRPLRWWALRQAAA